jgi:DNA adenine methylase
MDDTYHARLIEAIAACRGKVVISGYANPLYDGALVDWERCEIEMPNHSSQARAKQRRVEVLWFNPACRPARREWRKQA